MDNRELDRAVAEKFFKQPKPIVTHSQHLNPIQSGVWVCEPAYHGGDVCQWEPLHFTANPLACSLVLDEIERRGWGWEWLFEWDKTRFVVFHQPHVKIEMLGGAVDDNRYRAVCEAVLQAAEKE